MAIRKRAKRDVRAAYKPQLNAIRRAEQQTRRDFKQDNRRVGSIYDALAQNLAPIGGQYDASAQAIASGFQDDLGSLASLLHMGPNVQGVAPGEFEAARGAFGAVGSGALANLAGDRQRQAAWQGSTQRQAGLEQMTAHRNLLEDKRTLLDDLRNGRIDLKGEMGAAILARIGELRDRRAQQALAQKELALRQKLAEDQLGFQKKQYRNERVDEKDAKRYTLDQIEEKHDRGRIAPIRKGIQNLLDQIDNLEGFQTGVGRPSDEVQRKIHRKESRIKRKRKKIKRIKRTDSYT